VHEQLDRHPAAILAQVLLLVADGLAGTGQFLQLLALRFAPLGRGQRVGPIQHPELKGAVAGQLLERRIEQAQAPIEVAHRERLGGALDHPGQKLVLLPDVAQGLLAVVGRGFVSGTAQVFGQQTDQDAVAQENGQRERLGQILDLKTPRRDQPPVGYQAADARGQQPGRQAAEQSHDDHDRVERDVGRQVAACQGLQSHMERQTNDRDHQRRTVPDQPPASPSVLLAHCPKSSSLRAELKQKEGRMTRADGVPGDKGAGGPMPNVGLACQGPAWFLRPPIAGPGRCGRAAARPGVPPGR
jgi:hypothetical protein